MVNHRQSTSTLLALLALASYALAENWIIQLKTPEAKANVVSLYSSQAGFAAQSVSAMADEGSIQVGDNFHALVMQATDKEMKKQLEGMQGVLAVEPEQTWHVMATERNAVVGLDRIDSARGTDGSFTFDDNAGRGVTVVVLDTGVDVNHADLRGRARQEDLTGEGGGDGNGHGTHCAGTIAGKKFGVAKNANIIGIKVLGANGSGSNAVILRGMQRASQLARDNPNTKFVVSMSLGGPKGGNGAATQNAVDALVRQGVPVVVAAGNESSDACGVSPAFVRSAITVGASDPRNDQFASFSNFGSCVDIIAPGVRIESARANSGSGSSTLSGTSMATPHVAGVMASLMGSGLTGQQATQRLLADATPNAIRGQLRGTANRFLRLTTGRGGGRTPAPRQDDGEEPADPAPADPAPPTKQPPKKQPAPQEPPTGGDEPAEPPMDDEEPPKKQPPTGGNEDLPAMLDKINKALEKLIGMIGGGRNGQTRA